MEFKNAVKKTWDLQARTALPKPNEIRPAGFVRLQAENGSFIWARVLRRYDRQLILVADDSLPSGDLRRGEEILCSVGCVFATV
jgi:hypothetical protein